MQAPPVSEQQLEELLQWLANIPFTRPKKNMNRDFADGVLVAEIFKQYFPNMVQLHNYQSSTSSAARYMNWKTLNQKIFKKLGFQIHKNDIENIINVVPGSAERVLFYIHQKINTNARQKPKIIGSPQKKQSFKQSQEGQELSTKLAQKEDTIRDLRDTIQILQAKMKKMEQLCKLKDAKIDSLLKKIQQHLVQ